MTYPWNAGEVLAAADLNAEFASKVDYALPVNAQTGTTYTFVAADAEKLTTASNGSAVTLTIPPASSVAWPDNTVLRVVNYGAGAVTIDGGSGVTVTNTSSTIAQYGAAVAIRTGSDAWTVVPFGGGDIPAATVSSPAATGQYTDGGGQTWDYYTFTSSGTLTVGTAGLATVLVVAGGGGGGSGNNTNRYGGGGGAGGYTGDSVVYLDAASYTVTVGAGGSGGTSGAGQTNGNASGLGAALVAIGGGIGGHGGYGRVGGAGGSGGGGGYDSGVFGAGGSTQYAAAGNNGGPATSGGVGGGGGGAAEAGNTDGVGSGGDGLSSSITGTAVARGGGGAGRAGSGGTGGGGAVGAAGAANTGGGGGGNIYPNNSGAGGSGIVIVRVAT